jgi:hypothetical protein
VRRFLRHEANVVKGGYKATKRNVGRFGRFLTKPYKPKRNKEDEAEREIVRAPSQAPCPADLAGPALRASMRAVCAAALVDATPARWRGDAGSSPLAEPGRPRRRRETT